MRSLKVQYEQSTRIMSHMISNKLMRVVWILGQHKKPFTDGEVVKECMTTVAQTLFEGKEKQELCEKIKQIPMSTSSATKKSDILTLDVLTQRDEAMKKAPCVSLDVDEPTDM